MSEEISNADFGTGILVGFAALGINQINTSRLDLAAVKAFDELATVEDANLRFHMSLDRLHGDAPEAKRAIGGAMARGLGHFDSDGILHIDISQDSTDLYFEHLPLTAENWKTIAKVALDHLRGE
jgi:hypothetical protein